MFTRINSKIVVAILFLLIVVLSGCGGGILGLQAEQNPPLNELTLGKFDSKIKVSVPFELNAGKRINVSEDIRPYILGQERLEGYNKTMGLEITNAFYDAKLVPVNWKPDLEGAADGAINSLARSPKINNFSSNKTYITVSENPAILAKLSFYDRKILVESKILFLVDGYSLWMINTRYSQSDEAARKLVDKILQTVMIIR